MASVVVSEPAYATRGVHRVMRLRRVETCGSTRCRGVLLRGASARVPGDGDGDGALRFPTVAHPTQPTPHRAASRLAVVPRCLAGKPTSSTPPTVDDPPVCRFCFDEANSRPGGELLTPCECKGTQAYVHLGCLRRWQTVSVDGAPRCQVCGRPFRAPPLPFFATLARRLRRGLWRRAVPYAVCAFRLAADLAQPDNVVAEVASRGVPQAILAALFFLRDCELAHTFTRLDLARNIRAHVFALTAQLALVSLLGDGSNSAGDAPPAWVFYAHDFFNFPHLMSWCHGYLFVEGARTSGGGIRPAEITRGPGARGGAGTGSIFADVAAAARRLETFLERRYFQPAALAARRADPAALRGGAWDAPWLGELTGRW